MRVEKKDRNHNGSVAEIGKFQIFRAVVNSQSMRGLEISQRIQVDKWLSTEHTFDKK